MQGVHTGSQEHWDNAVPRCDELHRLLAGVCGLWQQPHLQHVLGKQRELPAGEDEDELPQVRKWGASRNDSSRWHNTPTEHGVEGAGLHSVRDGTLPTDENAEVP